MRQQSGAACDDIIFEHQWGANRGLDVSSLNQADQLKRRAPCGFESRIENVGVKNNKHDGIAGDTKKNSSKTTRPPERPAFGTPLADKSVGGCKGSYSGRRLGD